MHCKSKTFYTVNQSQTIICMTFKLDMKKSQTFLNIERLWLTVAVKNLYTGNAYERNPRYKISVYTLQFA
jgi:hypothetical protein